jgi:hypothetical protein
LSTARLPIAVEELLCSTDSRLTSTLSGTLTRFAADVFQNRIGPSALGSSLPARIASKAASGKSGPAIASYSAPTLAPRRTCASAKDNSGQPWVSA